MTRGEEAERLVHQRPRPAEILGPGGTRPFRSVVVLVELPETAVRLDELLYVGLNRATTQLIVIAPLALAARPR